ncbi:MAG: hypothetical protein JWL83_3845 [Actinomycetia bacterium]|nr:hypothetical protein [Actinomycetes bacterium]
MTTTFARYMHDPNNPDPFTPDDLQTMSALAIDAWQSGVDRDWSVPAGTLEWSCLRTAAHTVDCVFSYALFLASRKVDAYPGGFDELRALPDATAADMVDNLRAVTTMLWAVIATAEPEARAAIGAWSRVETGGPNDFAARGALEMSLHTHDIATGLHVPFAPPPDVAQRLRDHTSTWPGQVPVEPSADAWSDVLESSGRAQTR